MIPKLTTKNWWAGVIVTISIFVATTIYASGKITSQLEQHILNDPTYREMVDEFARKENVYPRLDKIEQMIEYLYQKEGGKPID